MRRSESFCLTLWSAAMLASAPTHRRTRGAAVSPPPIIDDCPPSSNVVGATRVLPIRRLRARRPAPAACCSVVSRSGPLLIANDPGATMTTRGERWPHRRSTCRCTPPTCRARRRDSRAVRQPQVKAPSAIASCRRQNITAAVVRPRARQALSADRHFTTRVGWEKGSCRRQSREFDRKIPELGVLWGYACAGFHARLRGRHHSRRLCREPP